MSKYKSWGLYTEQTVRKAKDNQNIYIIRQSNSQIRIKKKEIPSLIIALLEVAK